MLKKIALGIVALLVVLAIGGYFLGSNADSLVRAAIEKYGTAATQTSVKLAGVTLHPLQGEAGLSGLSVGNPAGFAADKSLYLGKIAVKLDPQSLRGTGPIVINDVTIEKPEITYEVNNAGESNLQTIARNAQSYAASLVKSGGDAPTKEEPAGKGQGRKVIIKNLTISGAQMSISQALLQGKQLSATLPVIHLTNIGKSEGGATPAEVAQQILNVLTTSASKIATADLAKELGGNLKGATSGILDNATGGAGGVGGAVKGLFGN